MGTPRMSGFIVASSRPSETSNEHQNAVAIPIESNAAPRSSSRPRPASPSAALPLPSSLQQKTPARSYYQSAYYGSLAAPDNSYRDSRSVRRDTAELATRALSDAGDNSPRGKPMLPSTAPPTSVFEEDEPEGSLEQSDVQDTALFSERRPEPAAGHLGSPSGSSSPVSILSRIINHSRLVDEESQTLRTADTGSVEDLNVVTVGNGIISQPEESTPLLRATNAAQKKHARIKEHSKSADGHFEQWKPKFRGFMTSSHLLNLGHSIIRLGSMKLNNPKRIKSAVMEPISCLPAVLLGLLLNVLDALSYGMILFPLSQSVFSELAPDGLSMFYVSCIVSQLVYSLGGSTFKGGIGSEMIEVVPFFHKMAFTIMGEIGEDKPQAIIATTILSYSLSSLLTGFAFYFMGISGLGTLICFFPRHILIACIGGVGYFLAVTGLEVSARLDGNLSYDFDTLKKLLEPTKLALWLIPLLLALLLTFLKKRIHHPLTDAVFFLCIGLVFYVVMLVLPGVDLDILRSSGWVFEAPKSGVPWYHFYTLWDFQQVDWSAVARCIPAMFALTFFGILHVPINVPALAFSTGQDDVDVDRELRAHGISNALSGLCGSIQNYLVYTNSVLFMRSGGDRRIAGVMLAIGTGGIMLVGPVLIGFIPVMVVGSLIFYLGLDLLREALLATWGRVHTLEYATILIIVLTMGTYDFVVGILVGIVLACVGFVIHTSRISAVRSTLPGGIASSTVRRHPIQAVFLQEVGQQIYVMRLAGFLFFGTIVGVENRIRSLLSAYSPQTIQFLVIDLSSVDGVDFSSAEAFGKISRILKVSNVRMIICGFSLFSEIGKSLCNVGLLEEADGVKYFEVLNSALEYCENQLLKALYQRTHDFDKQHAASGPVGFSQPVRSTDLRDAFSGSPRRGQLHAAATTTLEEHGHMAPFRAKWQRYGQPLQLVLQVFAGISDKDDSFWKRSAPFFRRREFEAGAALYHSGDSANEFYLVERGILKAKYQIEGQTLSEVIVAGTTCGELPFFSETKRTSTTFADQKSVVWVLDRRKWNELQSKEPDIARELLKLSLKLTSERMKTITNYMLLRGT